MIVMQWIGVGYMLLFLGAVPLTLVQFGAFVGTCARVGRNFRSRLSRSAHSDLFRVLLADEEHNRQGRSFVFPIIALFFALGMFL